MSSSLSLIIPFILGLSGGAAVATVVKRALQPMPGSRVTFAKSLAWRLLGLPEEVSSVRRQVEAATSHWSPSGRVVCVH